jgi:WD40 repeat protein
MRVRSGISRPAFVNSGCIAMDWIDDADGYSVGFTDCFSNRYSESNGVLSASTSSSNSFLDKLEVDDDLSFFSDVAASQFESDSVLHNFTAMHYGFLARPSYRHPSENGDITCVTYNSRLQHFVIMDSSEVTTYDPKAQETRTYPFQHHDIWYIIHVDSFNIYFVITNTRQVKVLNKDFKVAYSLEDKSSVLDMVYNVKRQELVTCHVDGVKFWSYIRTQDNRNKRSTTMSQFALQLRKAITPPVAGDTWVHKLYIDAVLGDSGAERLCCLVGEDLLFYDMEGELIMMWQGLHSLSILSYVHIPCLKLSVTSGKDCCVKVWTEIGGLVHQFTTHTKPVIEVIHHPDSHILLLSGSSDGMVRVWNLETMEEAYSTSVCEGELKSLRVLHDNDGGMLWACTRRTVNLFSLNHLLDFWCQLRCKVCSLQLVVSQSKCNRVTAVGEDHSIRILSEKTGQVLSVLLPPPSGLLTVVKAAAYSRKYNLVFTLISERDLWVYTTRTNPSCRIDVWDGKMLDKLTGNKEKTVDKLSAIVITSLCILSGPVVITTDEGEACPDCQEFIVLGLQVC